MEIYSVLKFAPIWVGASYLVYLMFCCMQNVTLCFFTSRVGWWCIKKLKKMFEIFFQKFIYFLKIELLHRPENAVGTFRALPWYEQSCIIFCFEFRISFSIDVWKKNSFQEVKKQQECSRLHPDTSSVVATVSAKLKLFYDNFSLLLIEHHSFQPNWKLKKNQKNVRLVKK